MNLIRRTGTILTIAAALSLPALASAEQAPTEACEGNKAEHKQPTAESTTKVNTQKSDSKQPTEKSEQKPAEKPAPDQAGRS